MAHIFQRGHQQTWWIKYYVGGQQVYRSLHTDEYRAAKRIKQQIEAEESSGDLVAPSRIRLEKFLQEFCQFLSTIRTTKSYKNDVSCLRVFFGPICDALKPGTGGRKRREGEPKPPKRPLAHLHVKADYLEQINTGLIEQFLARRIREQNIAPKTANRFREVLHRMFNYAAKNCSYVSPDRRHPNPAAAVERRREPAHTIRYLKAHEIVQQLTVLKDKPTLQALVATLIYAGLRREEALWLTLGDVDLEQRLLFVRAKTVDGVFWQPKTKRNRVVPISAALQQVLSLHLPRQKGPWVFASPQGQHWHPDNFSQDLRAINKKHALSWSCLDYRHTFGSQLAQKGESLFKIATLLGNSPAICQKHYAALVPESMHEVVEFGSSARPADVASRQVEDLLQQLMERLDQRQARDVPLRLAQ